MKITKTRKTRRTTRTATITTGQLAKAWLVAQPRFQRLMLDIAERFAEHVVVAFGATDEPLSTEYATFGEWLGPAGTKLYYWDRCEDYACGHPLLVAVPELELDILRRSCAPTSIAHFEPRSKDC